VSLTATNVVKRFGGVTALAGVDLALAEDEILGLIGPNGSGKTTLVNCISGVLRIDEGEISFRGDVINTASRTRRARAGMARTFQTPKLFTDLTVRENVEAGTSSMAGRSSEVVELTQALMDRLGLSELGRDVVSKLPYGYQRRVEVARALAGRPSVLLLDEPAAGLNDTETAELLELLREIRRDHACGILVIDHDMSLVMEVSDRVTVLDEGRVIFAGLPQEAFKQQQVIEAYLGVD
jgi:branched-chain amino acid transport system ATP-binding protein